MSDTSASSPFRPLGRRLKALRDQAKESLAEASGAVEIDVQKLASFELGKARPTEDILLLLISHFGANDDEAIKMWELAGYTTSKIPQSQMTSEEPLHPSILGESKVLFTDIVDVIVNNYGVVMNFMQSTGPNNPPESVARVGMSREHAKSVLKILQATLEQTERGSIKFPRKLIAPDGSDDKPRNSH